VSNSSQIVNLKNGNNGSDGRRSADSWRTFPGVANVGIGFSRGRWMDTVDIDILLLEESQILPRLVPKMLYIQLKSMITFEN
jgi:hypothetical protein